MSKSPRIYRVRVPKQESEVHVLVNPLPNDDESPSSRSENSIRKARERLTAADYEAPSTASSLRANSHWLIVRRNLHRIRYMGFNDGGKKDQLPDIYLGLQMVRELRRAQEKIKNVDKEENFRVIKQFSLAGNQGQTRKFDTSHVQPDDALIYDRLGEEPLLLQNLLYYFSERDIVPGDVFWDFLNEVNHVLNLKRKRTVLVQRLRRLALTVAVIIYSLLGLMFFSMVISVITTATKMNDPEVEWMNQHIEGYSSNILSLR